MPRFVPPALRIAADGEPVYLVRSGAAYRGVRAQDVGNGLFVIHEDVAGLSIEDIEVTRGYRVIEDKAPVKGQTASCVGLRLRGAKATELRRSFGRFAYASHDGLIQDVEASGMLTTGAHDLPVGLAFKDQAHDFRLERCTMRGFRWQRKPSQYWNGDGFSAERGNARLTFRQCAAWDNSDGGFDLKSTETLLDDCISGRNARNFRLWSSIRATQLTSVEPQKVGGIGDTVHFALMAPKAANAEPPVIHIEHLIVRSSRQWPLFDVHDGQARVIIDSHDIQVPPGTPLVRSRDGGSIPGGIQFRTAPPKL